MPVHPTARQVEGLARSTDDGTVVMLNLLRFKPRADGIDEGISGAEAYARYGPRPSRSSARSAAGC
jgi:hypothetical protein